MKNAEILKQVLIIRDSGMTNMFDYPVVMKIAEELEWYELVDWIGNHITEYGNLILTGELPPEEDE
jgi:hypothetical protein